MIEDKDRLQAIVDAAELAGVYDWAAAVRVFTRRELEGQFGLSFLRGAAYVRTLMVQQRAVLKQEIAELQEQNNQKDEATQRLLELLDKLRAQVRQQDDTIKRLQISRPDVVLYDSSKPEPVREDTSFGFGCDAR